MKDGRMDDGGGWERGRMGKGREGIGRMGRDGRQRGQEVWLGSKGMGG